MIVESLVQLGGCDFQLAASIQGFHIVSDDHSVVADPLLVVELPFGIG